PWFPFFPPAPHGATDDELLQTHRPAMLYSPGIFKPIDPWLYARVLVREIRAMSHQCRPDLIDAHYEWPDGPAAAIAARALGIPFAITLRGKIVSQSRHAIRRRQMRTMLRAASVRIAVSRDLALRAARLM